MSVFAEGCFVLVDGDRLAELALQKSHGMWDVIYCDGALPEDDDDVLEERLQLVETTVSLEESNARWESCFGKNRKVVVLTVIHLLDVSDELKQEDIASACSVMESNIDIAVASGADGVFLIDHKKRRADVVNALVPAARRCLDSFGMSPDGRQRFLGVNYIVQDAMRALADTPALTRGMIDGIWIDNPLPTDVPTMRKVGFEGLYFGGVAFKTQDQLSEAQAAKAGTIAFDKMHVVTTSGSGTGIAAPASKLQRMRQVLPSAARLGLASGVTPENCAEFLPFVDAILVATGIGADFHNIDRSKAESLMDQVRGYNAQLKL